MLWSRLFIPTLRENPAEAEFQPSMLLRAGYIRPLGAGMDTHLPWPSGPFEQVQAIIPRYDASWGAGVYCPGCGFRRGLAGSPGRWALMGDNMFRLKDRLCGARCGWHDSLGFDKFIRAGRGAVVKQTAAILVSFQRISRRAAVEVGAA